MSHLRFKFDLEKLVQTLTYLAQAGVADLTKLKAAKLLYLADRQHLLAYGRPITGDRYIAMDLGPVPESAYQLMNRMSEASEVEDTARAYALEHLEIHLTGRSPYPILRAKQKADIDVFSESEIDVLRDVVREFAKLPASRLVDLTHEHAGYKHADAGRSAGSSVELPYDYFFDDVPEDPDNVRGVAEREQEDRDFADALQAAGRKAAAEQRRPASGQ
jgi:uncharacterized phage-associated protein